MKVQKKAQKKYISKANIDLYIFFIVHSQCFKTQKKKKEKENSVWGPQLFLPVAFDYQ